ncbi:PD-(D/E)XK nuclease superfamily [uncultured Caudovirales phage]|uniref:PD-(D/E)XK nuclease superfamily n=1 Tax=uncultured Caudovirales phage TaxID=2100421 RepID=A0A6J5KQU1_9CAUD|nr:PD-(D/E)XK nuclease superfamily [uncultured Caudovirales phage]
MNLVTTRSKPKSFAWSYSKLKNYETCPARYYGVDVSKNFKEEEGEALLYGNTLHKALASAISGQAPLPKPFTVFQPWVDKLCGFTNGQDVTLLVEQQLAITKELGPTEWFGRDAWYRGIADVIKIVGQVAVVLDWKTGKIVEDSVQLALMAQCVFAHHPQVEKIRTEFVWLKEDATTRADFAREDMVGVWGGLLPRVEMLKHAHDTVQFPAKPGNLCRKWCPVTSCPHNGK